MIALALIGFTLLIVFALLLAVRDDYIKQVKAGKK